MLPVTALGQTGGVALLDGDSLAESVRRVRAAATIAASRSVAVIVASGCAAASTDVLAPGASADLEHVTGEVLAVQDPRHYDFAVEACQGPLRQNAASTFDITGIDLTSRFGDLP
jgi:hypothetical protein